MTETLKTETAHNENGTTTTVASVLSNVEGAAEAKVNTLFKSVATFGLATTLIGIIFLYIVIPLIDDAREANKKTSEAALVNNAKIAEATIINAQVNNANSRTNEQLVNNNEKLSDTVNRFSEGYEKQNRILEQIRDDQRKFPAVRESGSINHSASSTPAP